MRTLVISKHREPDSYGGFGDYYRIGKGKGIKVFRDHGHGNLAKDRLTRLSSHGDLKEVDDEANNIKQTESSGVSPKFYETVIVKIDKLYYPGIVMQHIQGKTYYETFGAEGPDMFNHHSGPFSKVTDGINKKLKPFGIFHGDLNDENVIVKNTKTGYKYYAVDFGPNSIEGVYDGD